MAVPAPVRGRQIAFFPTPILPANPILTPTSTTTSTIPTMPTAFQSAVVTSSASATGAATTTFIPIIVNAATSSIDAVVESEVPAATVPSSVPPGVDLGPLLNFTTWLMTGLAFAILMLRIYCKASRKRRLWWDDYVLSLAWVSQGEILFFAQLT